MTCVFSPTVQGLSSTLQTYNILSSSLFQSISNTKTIGSSCLKIRVQQIYVMFNKEGCGSSLNNKQEASCPIQQKNNSSSMCLCPLALFSSTVLYNHLRAYGNGNSANFPGGQKMWQPKMGFKYQIGRCFVASLQHGQEKKNLLHGFSFFAP